MPMTNQSKKLIKLLIGIAFKNTLMRIPIVSPQIIIMYHKVVQDLPEFIHDPNLYVSSDTLNMHLQELKKYFRVVTLTELMNNESEAKRLCAITFDDGWRDNFDFAFPVLKKNNVSATIFLPVNDIATANWFWFEHIFYLGNVLISDELSKIEFIHHFQAVVPQWFSETINIPSMLALVQDLKNQPSQAINAIISDAYSKFGIHPPCEKVLMDWKQVDKMGMNGITFGSHGLHHDILPLLDKKSQMKAICESLSILRDKTIYSIPYLSYPNGSWDTGIINIVKNAGYYGAATTKSGCVERNNPYLLNRIGCSEHSSNTAGLLWFQIAKAYSFRRMSQDFH